MELGIGPYFYFFFVRFSLRRTAGYFESGTGAEVIPGVSVGGSYYSGLG